MHTWLESTGVRLSCDTILFFNSNDKTQSGQSENRLTFRCVILESLCSRCTDVCDGSQLSRRIASSIDSATYNLAKHAAFILGPLVGKSHHHVNNTQYFVERISTLKLEDDETIVSYMMLVHYSLLFRGRMM